MAMKITSSIEELLNRDKSDKIGCVPVRAPYGIAAVDIRAV
jgi:hypothetical protein